MRLIACPKCRTQYDVSATDAAEIRCACGESVSAAVHAAVEAPVQRCGSCGAAVASDAPTCEFCRAPIVRDPRLLPLLCPECYARNAENFRFCASCGVEFRPQPLPGQAAAWHCPCCHERMQVKPVAGVTVQECPACYGLWVPEDHFDRLIDRAVEAQQARPSEGLGVFRDEVARARTTPAAVQYRNCPQCASPMTRKNFGRTSGVIVDWCGRHGTWLDADELAAIASFILGGGLERSALMAARYGADRVPPSAATPEQIEALLSTERMIAEARSARAHRRRFSPAERGSPWGLSLGDLLQGLLGL